MNNKYVIKITRRTPESWGYTGDQEDTHYYNGLLSDIKTAYNTRIFLTNVNKFTKQECKKNIKEIKRIYKENTDSGTLLKIEVLNSETLKPIIFHEPKYTRFTRFEIMDI